MAEISLVLRTLKGEHKTSHAEFLAMLDQSADFTNMLSKLFMGARVDEFMNQESNTSVCKIKHPLMQPAHLNQHAEHRLATLARLFNQETGLFICEYKGESPSGVHNLEVSFRS